MLVSKIGRKYRAYIAVVTVCKVMASLALFVPPAQAEINILEFSPSAVLMNSSDTQVNYKLDDFVNPQEVHFSWNFSQGMDSVLAPNLAQIKLKEAASGAEVELDRGDPAAFKLDENGVIAAGDFKYTEKEGGNQETDSNRMCLVELNLKSTSLKPGTNYVIELGAGIVSNNADTGKLGKTYSWAFTTTEIGDTSVPTWAQDSALQVTDLAPTSVTLSWPAAVDNTAVTDYQLYQDGKVVAKVNDTTWKVTDLTPGAGYIFKVEAGDTAGNWTKDGPQVTVITPSQELLTAPVLKADTTDNVVGNSITLTFEDNEGWRKAINGITVDGANLENTEYTISAGIIEIAAGVFTEARDYSIVVKAADYKDTTVTQKILAVDVDNNDTGGTDPVEEPGPVPGSDTENEKDEPEQPGKPLPKLTDINGHWAQKTIEELVATGAISGYPDGTFKPDQTITRAEFATILVKAWELDSDSGKVFADTSKHWAKDSIAIAAAHGIVQGYSDSTFGPNDNITRTDGGNDRGHLI